MSQAMRPAWMGRLVALVDQAFAVSGATTPGWDDPHPDRMPFEGEYSRCLDPGKYRILDARVDAWVRVLADRRLAQVTDAPRRPWIDGVRDPDAWWRVRRLEPAAPGGLMLVLASTLVDGQSFGLDVGISAAGLDTVLVDSLPDCGCDACDTGSADLLEALDGWFLTVARGGVVHARSDVAHISRTVDGWQASGEGRSETWLDDLSPAPGGVLRWVGSPWHPKDG